MHYIIGIFLLVIIVLLVIAAALWLLNLLLVLLKWISLIGIFVFIVMAIVSFVKNRKAGKESGVSHYLYLLIASIVIFGVSDYSQPKLHSYLTSAGEEVNEEKVDAVVASNQIVDTEKEEAKKKEEEEAAKKKEEEARNKAKEEEAQKKAEEDKLIEMERRKEAKVLFDEEFKGFVEASNYQYERIWDDFWVPTANGNLSNYEAYENMKDLEAVSRYHRSETLKFPNDVFIEEERELVIGYINNLSHAYHQREDLAKYAKKIFDKESIKPSEIDRFRRKVQELVAKSNDYYIEAQRAVIELEELLESYE
ncbi:hypothetical protein [Halalkalibacter nanhaiisediminis]|uniref:Uncharacterized protein n=1 Tax=Halalkalibacter nanhaiisediminis TaxID=688079 RepID=A0A562QH78_9BACI|nr:hypothetical protein [Halalkalibacter nanhaiisediminis]TWI56094.1 hypothetical protein IQ10_01982 [Halalkalibacter nanhaiisediminis]